MIPYYEFPLRQAVQDVTQPTQLDVLEQAKLLLDGFSGVRIEQPARGLVLRAMAERELDGAVTMLSAAFQALVARPIEVVYLEEGKLEPFARVAVTTPEALLAQCAAELERRSAALESVSEKLENRVLVAVAPLAKLLGLDAWLNGVAGGRAIAEYRFDGYRPRA